MSVSIVTPWLNASELCGVYEASVKGAQAVIVDNGSDLLHAERIAQMANRMGGVYIRNETNQGFAKANNQGLAEATGDIVVFMNNDVECSPDFLTAVERDVRPGALYGPSLLSKHGWAYIEGWCIAARREVWAALGGWDDWYYAGLYWEDNDLCARAVHTGYNLVQTTWACWHYGNYTSSKQAGAYDHSSDNQARFLARVDSWRI